MRDILIILLCVVFLFLPILLNFSYRDNLIRGKIGTFGEIGTLGKIAIRAIQIALLIFPNTFIIAILTVKYDWLYQVYKNDPLYYSALVSILCIFTNFIMYAICYKYNLVNMLIHNVNCKHPKITKVEFYDIDDNKIETKFYIDYGEEISIACNNCPRCKTKLTDDIFCQNTAEEIVPNNRQLSPRG